MGAGAGSGRSAQSWGLFVFCSMFPVFCHRLRDASREGEKGVQGSRSLLRGWERSEEAQGTCLCSRLNWEVGRRLGGRGGWRRHPGGSGSGDVCRGAKPGSGAGRRTGGGQSPRRAPSPGWETLPPARADSAHSGHNPAPWWVRMGVLTQSPAVPGARMATGPHAHLHHDTIGLPALGTGTRQGPGLGRLRARLQGQRGGGMAALRVPPRPGKTK